LLGRRVEGSSIADLNAATHGLGKRVPRVLDVFIMGLVHAHRLSETRKESPLEEPPSMDELVRGLSDAACDLRSLAEPVTADIVGVRSSHGEVAVYVDYPELTEEQLLLAKALGKHVGLPHPSAPGPQDPRIIIVEESLARDEQLRKIEGALPEQIDLSPMRPIS
jgi:hypothetical protein